MGDQEKAIGTQPVVVKERSSFNSSSNSLNESRNGETTKGGMGLVNRLAAQMKAETKGIDVVTDEEKGDESIINAASMWWSANMVISTFSVGALGVTVFSLSFFQCIMCVLFFNMLGALTVAYFSLFGVRLGLRQMILSRFLVGDWAQRIFAVVNMVACVGWGVVNIMTSAQLLHIINNGVCPPWAGCLILVLCSIIVTFFGYNIIHTFEKYSWISNMVGFIAIIARMAMSKTFTWGTTVGGPNSAGGVLSYGAAIYGFASGWTTYASDYTVYQPRNANPYRIFFGIFFGLLLPLVLTMTLGAACATGTLTNSRWKELYKEEAIGGLIYAILVEDSLHGFGEFLCVLLAFSTLCNNVPNMYSVALSAQSAWSSMKKVPRVFWTLVGNFTVLAISIPAYYHFEAVMENFMNMIGYYVSIYEVMCLSEHFIWNKNNWGAYDYENFNDKKKYPVGIAGVFGFCCGCAGAALGMNQLWYQGVFGKMIGQRGGDIGFELAGGFSLVGFNIARYFEIKYVGR